MKVEIDSFSGAKIYPGKVSNDAYKFPSYHILTYVF